MAPGCFTGGEELDDVDQNDVDEPDCKMVERGDTKLQAGNWLRGARVAGLATFAEATLCDVTAELDRMADERVTVVEVDGDLSSYLDEAGFVEQMRVVDLVARECHARNMRCVAYWPILESLTENAANIPHTMAKDHPEWLQRNIDGTPNVFIGNGQVFWVADGVESAWLCPTSGYVDYFVERVARLARTAVDGLWGDVPLFSDIVGIWPCVNDSCNAQFKRDTGFDAPAAVDWNDPAFVRWVKFRHQVLWELEQRILVGAKQAKPEFEVIIETVTMDYGGATKQGLDGAHGEDGLVHRVWEVDVVSDSTSMQDARADDWYSMATMLKHARACSDTRPAWTFCYGMTEPDAERVMSLTIATGCCPYETKIPEMNTSVSSEFRKRMFAWLERNPQILLSSRATDVSVLYSSMSRDVIDRAKGLGLYSSTNFDDGDWWTTKPSDSVKEMEYLGDYRGVCKFLFQNHIPFDSVTMPHADAKTLSGSGVIFVPSLASLASDVIVRLRQHVVAGGTCVITGPDGGAIDENGKVRPSAELLDAFEVSASITPAAWVDKAIGKGRLLYHPTRAGYAFLRDANPAILGALSGLPRGIDTDAPGGVIIERRVADTGELVLACANFEGLGTVPDQFTPVDVSFSCAVEVGGRPVRRVLVTKPDAGVADVEAPFTREGSRVRFSMSIHAVAVAIVEFA